MFRAFNHAACVTVAALLFLWGAASSDLARAASIDLLKGKTVRVVLSGGGSGTDTYGRAFIAAMERLLPDTTFLVQAVGSGTGGGALALSEVENASGSTISIAITNIGPVYNQLMQSNLAFDLTRFHWIGSITSNQRIAAVPAKIGHMSPAELKKLDRRIIAGVGSAGAAAAIETLAISSMLDQNFKVAFGLGEDERLTLLLAGDIDVMIGSYVNFKALVDKGELFPLFQYQRLPDQPALASVPTLRELAPDPEHADIVGLFEMLNTLGRLALAAPATDPATVDALRAAFDMTMSAPETKAEFEKAKLVFAPTPGAKLDEMVGAYLVKRDAGDRLNRFVECGQRRSDDPSVACD